MRQNLFGRDHDAIRAEFEANAELLQKRKNGVYLFHEIISITRAKGLSAEEQKQRLYEIAQEYVSARCPDNLVYGGLHEDKDHSYHMHLMISANRAGDRKRQRLSKHQFRAIQVQLEEHVLQKYPELEQKLAIGKRSERGRSKAGDELERRTGAKPKKEAILGRVRAAYEGSMDRDSLFAALGHEGLEIYVRGKTVGVVDLETGKRHRLKTLDLELADQMEIRLSGQEMETQCEAEKMSAGEKEKEQGKSRKQHEQAAEREPEPYTETTKQQSQERETGEEKDMSEPVTPNEERRELIDKAHVKPDPYRDRLSMQEWNDHEKFSTKVQQSWRRTMDDFRGRTKDLEEKALGKEHKGRDEPER